MRISTTLFAALLALACGNGYAQTFRWVDKDGKTQYGDIAPMGVKATVVKRTASDIAPPPTALPSTAKDGKGTTQAPTSASALNGVDDRQSNGSTARIEKDRVNAATRQKNCEWSQGILRSLKSGQRQAEASRQAPLDETRAEIAKNCK